MRVMVGLSPRAPSESLTTENAPPGVVTVNCSATRESPGQIAPGAAVVATTPAEGAVVPTDDGHIAGSAATTLIVPRKQWNEQTKYSVIGVGTTKVMVPKLVGPKLMPG